MTPLIMATQSEPSQSSEESPVESAGLAKKWRLLLSLIVCFHLLAVVLPPLSVQTVGPIGASPSVQTALLPVRGYGEFLYIDRGYAFFAPDPGPSHLIQAAVKESDGTLSESMYPDLDDQWPRLNYHRHFMLAEFLHEIYVEPIPTFDNAELTELERQLLPIARAGRARYEHVRQSIADHLKSVNDGKQILMRRIEHSIPSPVDFARGGISLTDGNSYNILYDRPIDPQTGQPIGPPESIPLPETMSETDSSNESTPLLAPRDDDKAAPASTVEPSP